MANKLTDVFMALVKIDSPSGEEKEMGEYVRVWLKRMGFDFREDKVGNILGFLGEYKKEPLLVSGHMDTVEPGRSIKPVIRDGYILAESDTVLGADNKVNIAAIMCAVEQYKDSFGVLPNVELLFSVREEIGGGIENFPIRWLQSKSGFVFDRAKPLGGIVMSSPHIINFKIRLEGKEAHAARPQEGVNSLAVALSFMNKIVLGRQDDGETTVNIGRIVSGSGTNVVPGETLIEGEIRSFNKKNFDNHLRKIRLDLEESLLETKVGFDWLTDGYSPGYEHSEKDPFIGNLVSVYKDLGLEVVFDKSVGVSDANILVDGGIKVVNLSDGSENAHSREERILIENLTRLQEIIFGLMKKFD